MKITSKEEKELHLQINHLFSCTAKPVEFKAILMHLINQWKNISFLYSENKNLKYKTQTGITADNNEEMRLFLTKEKRLAVDAKEFEKAAQIRDLLNNQREVKRMEYFQLSYVIRNKGNGIIVTFSTNSKIFKNLLQM